MPLKVEIKTVRSGFGRGRRLGILGLAGILAGMGLLTGPMASRAQAAQSVSLGWQPSPDVNAAGYNIYYGTASHAYDNKINVGNVAVAVIDGLVEGTTYYFAATTYDAANQESGFSNEAGYEVPAAVITNVLAAMQIQTAPDGQFLLTISGTANQSYDIEATEDFLVWTVIGTAVTGDDGLLEFADVNAPNFPRRFYRTREIP